VVLEKDPKSASEALSDFVLALFWDELEKGDHTSALLEKRLLDCVYLEPPAVVCGMFSALQNLLEGASKYELTTKTKKKWTFSGFFRSCGVRTPTGQYYDGEGGKMNPSLYQYCIGTDMEVTGRGLKACSIAPFGPAPVAKSQSRFVKQVMDVQQTTNEHVEVLEKQVQMQKCLMYSLFKNQQLNDDLSQKARDVFDLYDVNKSKTIDEKEFLSCWNELMILDDVHFGKIESEPDIHLKEAFNILGGGEDVIVDVFVEFFRKAHSFTLSKAILLLKTTTTAQMGATKGKAPTKKIPYKPQVYN
jgi:hypothetical protein